MWSPKVELAKRAVDLARKKHPNGFNKQQIIEASKEVYGGFGVTQANPLITKKIRTMEDVGHMGNAMANIDGRYPAGMSGCYVVGLNGGCGVECPVYLEGDCKSEEMMDLTHATEEQKELHIEIYGED